MAEPRTPVVPDPVAALAVPLVLVPTAVAAWWLVGDLSSSVPPGTALDHAVLPLDVAPVVATVAGGLATVVCVAALGGAAVAVRAGRLRRPWLTLALVVAVCGVVVGWADRVLTAGVIGENIGAGLMVVVVAPALGVVLLIALARALRLVRRGPPVG